MVNFTRPAESNEQQMLPIRVTIQQPALPAYRIPVFSELASRDGIELTLAYCGLADLPNAEHGNAFAAYQSRISGPANVFFWDAAQWRECGGARADVVVLNWNLRYASLWPALLRSRRRGVGTVLWGHGYSKNDSLLKKWLRRKVTSCATATLFYSEEQAVEHRSKVGLRSGTFVARNTIDSTAIDEAIAYWTSERLVAFRDTHKLTSKKVILFVSRLLPANRVDLLLSSFVEVFKAEPDCVLVIIGEGSERQNLRARAGQLGISNAVRFVPSTYVEMELAPWFLSSILFCYPENIGLSLLHAFAYGVPVVTADDPKIQNPEFGALRHNENGLVFERGHLPGLTRAIKTLVDDESCARRLGDGALATFRRDYSLNQMVDGLERAIRYAHVNRPAGNKKGRT